MSAAVVFFKPAGIGAIAAPGVGVVRVQETITVPNSTTAAAQEGEAVMVYNGESGAVAVALGTAPDAAATSANGDVTTAGFPVGHSQTSHAFVAKAGQKVSVKAIA